MIDAQLASEWVFMLDEAQGMINDGMNIQAAVVEEIRSVSAALGVQTQYRPSTSPVVHTSISTKPRSTFHETRGDRQALLRHIKRALDGDPVHGGAQSPIKLVRTGGREAILYNMEEVYDEFGIQGG